MEPVLAIGDYLRIFARYWWVVLIVTALGAAIGYGTTWIPTLLGTKQYVSTARLFVTTQSGTSVGDAYQNNLFSQERVVSYAGLATSQQVATRAVDQLKLPISADDLRAKITATPLPKTVLLEVSATDADPANAQSYANAVADQLVRLASELETSRRGGTPAAGAIVVDDAAFGVLDTGMKMMYRVGLGAFGGLVVGLALAILLGNADSRVRRRERLEEATGALVIGSLVDDPKRPVGVVDLDAGGVAVERLRELRTNIQFAKTADAAAPHVIAVTSPTAGDGRSTTAVDLAAVFAETGHSVVLVDGDLVNPTLAQRFELTDDEHDIAEHRGLVSVLAGTHRIEEAVIDNVEGLPFALLPAGTVPTVGRPVWTPDLAAHILGSLSRNFDYVIIDTPPLNTCTDGAVVAAVGDGAILLARIGHTKIPAVRRALEVLAAAKARTIGAVVTCEPGHRGELAKSAKGPGQTSSADADGSASATPTGTDADDARNVEPRHRVASSERGGANTKP